MGTAMSTPELQEVVERLAREFKLGISRYFGETYVPTVFSTPPEKKLAEAVRIIEGMTEPKLYLFVCHPGVSTPELAAMTDLNPTGVKPMAAHRQAETDLLCSKALRAAIERRGIQLTNYNELRATGLEHMNRPWTADPYKPHREPTTQPKDATSGRADH